MAERPIFVPETVGKQLVREVSLSLKWHSGVAPVQKERNIFALHAAASAAGFSSQLEISTKSSSAAGRRLSAFSLRVKTSEYGEIPLECAFQGSKVFERGGPYTDLYLAEPRDAKRDERLKESGALTGFLFEGFAWPSEPKTAFYDWLYVRFLNDWREWAEKLSNYSGFTDIEFNPQRSISCQARSVALFVALLKRGLLDDAVSSPENFISLLRSHDYRPQLRGHDSPLFDRGI